MSEDIFSIRAVAADIASELREHPERWTPWASRDAQGVHVFPRNPAAISWSLMGFLMRRGLDDYHRRDVWDAFRRVLGPRETSVMAWETADGRVAADIIALCERVAELTS